MPKKLDRNRPFSTSYGETNARYLQDGTWFDNEGNALEGAEATKGIARLKPHEMRARTRTRVIEEVIEDEEPEETELAPAADAAALADELKPLNNAQVKSIFRKAGGPKELEAGEGARQRMVDWLLAQASAETSPPPANEPA